MLKNNITFALAITQSNYGSLAEWLGTGLQNRLQQFESARNLSKRLTYVGRFFVSYRERG